MSELTRFVEAWPRLADGLFDFLADIDMPDETLADLDAAIHACRLIAEAETVKWCDTHQQPLRSCRGGNPECRIVSKLLAVYPKEAENGDEDE